VQTHSYFAWEELLEEMRVEVVDRIIESARSRPVWKVTLLMLGHTNKDHFTWVVEKKLSLQGWPMMSIISLHNLLEDKIYWPVYTYLHDHTDILKQAIILHRDTQDYEFDQYFRSLGHSGDMALIRQWHVYTAKSVKDFNNTLLDTMSRCLIGIIEERHFEVFCSIVSVIDAHDLYRWSYRDFIVDMSLISAVGRFATPIFADFLRTILVDFNTWIDELFSAAAEADNLPMVQYIMADTACPPSAPNSELIQACYYNAFNVVAFLLKDPRVDPRAQNCRCIVVRSSISICFIGRKCLLSTK
jgi:hypothetical protein